MYSLVYKLLFCIDLSVRVDHLLVIQSVSECVCVWLTHCVNQSVHGQSVSRPTSQSVSQAASQYVNQSVC